MSGLFDKVSGAVNQLSSDFKTKLGGLGGPIHSHTHHGLVCHEGAHTSHEANRFLSFAPQREGNEVKWYVDGCGYMWAVSVALEQARESIWILDCKNSVLELSNPS
jgi:phospholipase D1/2